MQRLIFSLRKETGYLFCALALVPCSWYFYPTQSSPSWNGDTCQVWLVTEGRPINLTMGESSTTGGKDAASAPVETWYNCCRSEPLFTTMNLKYKFKKQKGTTTNKPKKPKLWNHYWFHSWSFTLLLSQNSCSFSRNSLAAHETLTESNSLKHSLYILVV